MVHKKQWFKIHIGSLFIMLICHFSEYPKQVELRNFRACIFAWYMYWYIDLDQEIITLFQFILVCSHRSWICIYTCFARDWTRSFAMLRGFSFLNLKTFLQFPFNASTWRKCESNVEKFDSHLYLVPCMPWQIMLCRGFQLMLFTMFIICGSSFGTFYMTLSTAPG